ncbi:cytochrome b/b6 domain-containing protein [Actinomadura keratinilytica]|uniref:cytochrome b/b6 domain-containing protein n=1 Tax=Actinomadura keratinilytica TaxID=547461 RepID=UPI003605DB2D
MRRPDPGHRDDRLLRFTRAERWVHHATALLMLACLVTALLLYVPALSSAVGRRDLIRPLHTWCGFALPVPVLVGLLSRAFRADLRRLNRFGPHDGEWLRRADRRAVRRVGGLDRGVVPVGKFNAGQKLNAAFTAGAILVMLGTGAMLAFPGPWPVHWRTGATFVHDWLFLVVAVVTAGHLWYALRDRGRSPASPPGTSTGRGRRATTPPGWTLSTARAARRPHSPRRPPRRKRTRRRYASKACVSGLGRALTLPAERLEWDRGEAGAAVSALRLARRSPVPPDPRRGG